MYVIILNDQEPFLSKGFEEFIMDEYEFVSVENASGNLIYEHSQIRDRSQTLALICSALFLVRYRVPRDSRGVEYSKFHTGSVEGVRKAILGAVVK